MKKFIVLLVVLAVLAPLGVTVGGPIEDMLAIVSQQYYENYQLDIESVGLGLYGGAYYDQGYRCRDISGTTPTLGNQEASLYIQDEFTAMGLTTSVHGSYGNVIGELTGTVTPAKVYIIGGHFDHVAGDRPGGDDNASGTAGVLEAARVMSQYQFESTIRFICFNAEEDGMLGSTEYVDSLTKKQQNNIEGMINLDMILRPGRDDVGAGTIIDIDLETRSGASGSTASINWSEAFQLAATNYVPSVIVDSTIWSYPEDYGDNASFTKAGIPAVMVIENSGEQWPDDASNNLYYHTYEDSSDRLANDPTNPSGVTYDYAFATDTVRVSAALIAQEAVITGFVAADTTAPTPDPMTWVTVPYATGQHSVAMEASVATDTEHNVQYKFICTAGGGNNSPWQTDTSYEDTGISGGVQYTYTVIARDTSGNHNTTAPSTAESATTDPDYGTPTPDPMTWATVPYAIPGGSKIAMVATTASDPSGVQYYFTNTTVVDGSHDSGWRNSASYTDTGLTPLTEYTYTVTVRDKSGAQNTTAASTPASATTAENNLVLPGSGGVLESFTSEYSIGWGAAAALTNGSTTDVGWCSVSQPTSPQEFVFSFAGGADATLNTAKIHTGNAEGQYFSKDVEVWTSANGTDFTLAGSGTLLNQQNYSIEIPLGAITAKKIMLSITSGYRNTYWELSEFEVYGEIGSVSNVTVPNVVGQAQATAQANIVAAGLVVGTVTTESSETVPAGDVISQDPTDGTSVPTGSSVDLVVSTGGAGCTATDIHVESISCAEVSCGGPNKQGQATVTIYDDCGNPVSGALVDVVFTGDINETVTDVATDASGQAVLTGSSCVKRPTFTVTVTDVTGALPYDSNDNVSDSCGG